MHVDQPAERPGEQPGQRCVDDRRPVRRGRWTRRIRLATVLLSAAAVATGGTVVAAAVGATAGTGAGPQNAAPQNAAPQNAGTVPSAVLSGLGSVPHQTATQPRVLAPSRTPTPTPVYDTAASPCSHSAVACVDIAAKKAWLQDADGVTRGPVPIETGQPGHLTPTGTFDVSWKAAYTESTIYGLPMPHAVFFAAGGIAFHEGPLDSPSHGCVHLSAADATAFFAALNPGDEVDVW